MAADEGGVFVHGAEALGALHAQRDPTGGRRELESTTRVGAFVMHIMVILKRPASGKNIILSELLYVGYDSNKMVRYL